MERPSFTAGPTLRRIRVTLAWALLLATACNEDPTPAPTSDAQVYRVVVDHLLPPGSFAPADDGELPIVYIEALDPDGIDIESQVALVDVYLDRYDVRFVDDIVEAVVSNEPDAPVRPGAALIGLGPVVGESPVELRVEVYRSVDDVDAYRYVLAIDAGRWTITGVPESIEPEVLVPSP